MNVDWNKVKPGDSLTVGKDRFVWAPPGWVCRGKGFITHKEFKAILQENDK